MDTFFKMATRFIYASKPVLFHANGLKFDSSLAPSDNATKYLLNTILADLIVKYNKPIRHKCTSFCGQPVQLILGFPHSTDVVSSVPPELMDLIQEYEALIKQVAYEGDMEADLQSIAFKLLPCPKVMEILNVQICL